MTQPITNEHKNRRQKCQRFAKLKRAAMPTHKRTQIAAHLILPDTQADPS
jgi:hypothetical protein